MPSYILNLFVEEQLSVCTKKNLFCLRVSSFRFYEQFFIDIQKKIRSVFSRIDKWLIRPLHSSFQNFFNCFNGSVFRSVFRLSNICQFYSQNVSYREKSGLKSVTGLYYYYNFSIFFRIFFPMSVLHNIKIISIE